VRGSPKRRLAARHAAPAPAPASRRPRAALTPTPPPPRRRAQAVAARAAQRDAGVGRCLFVDLDVHQGDGTATIFRDGAPPFRRAGGKGFWERAAGALRTALAGPARRA
jgi:hypothetical protein